MTSLYKKLLSKFEASSVVRRFSEGVFWLSLATFGTKALGFVGYIIVARTFSKEMFGEVSVVFSTYALFQFFAASYLGATAKRYIAVYRSKQEERLPGIIRLSLATTLFIAVVSAVVLFCVSDSIATDRLKAPGLGMDLQIVSVAVFCTAMNGVILGILAGFERFKLTSILTVFSNLAVTGASVIGAVKYGIHGYFIGFSVASLLGLFVEFTCLVFCVKRIGVSIFTFKGIRKELVVLWHYTLPAVLGGAVSVPVNWYCTSMLFRQFEGKEQLAGYSAAAHCLAIVTLLVGVFNQAASPILSNLVGVNDTRRFTRLWMTSTGMSGAVAAVLCVLLSLFGEEILGLFGKDFRADSSLMWYLSLLVVIQLIDRMVNMAYASSGRVWANLGFIIFLSLLILSFASVLIPLYGAVGLILSLSSAHLIKMLLSGTFMLRALHKSNKESLRHCTIERG